MIGPMGFAQPGMIRKGFTPQESYWMEKIEQESAERKRRANASGLGFLKFVEQMKGISQLATERGVRLPCCYIYEDKVVAQIQKVEWANTRGSASCLLYLTKIYTLNNHRDSGLGTRFMEDIKRIVDETGMVLFLRALSFGFSGEEGGLPHAFLTMGELLMKWEQHETLTGAEADVLLFDWYRRLGFLIGCTHDGDGWPVEDYHTLNQQFIYVGGKNLERDVYLRRTKVDGMCEKCRVDALGMTRK